MNKKSSPARAFVLLYSLLVASIVLAIGMSLATIISKQIILSSIGKMSRIAYYAADSGRDCAFFWAVKYGSTVPSLINEYPPVNPIYCQESTVLLADDTDESITVLGLLKMYGIDLASEGYDYNYLNFKQDLKITNSQNACNKVSVFIFPEDSLSLYSTIIVSRGFSAPCGTLNPRTVGRSVINTVRR